MKKEYMEMIQTIDDTASEMEMLEIAISILDNLTNTIGINMETERDRYNYNRLTTCLLKMNDILKEKKEEENDKLTRD